MKTYEDGLQVAPAGDEAAGLELQRDGKEAPEPYVLWQPLKESTSKPEDHDKPTRSRRKLCGLNPPTFWLSIAVLALIIAIAAVAGGIGAALGSTKSTPTPIVATPANSSSPSNSSCPSTSSSCTGNGTVYISSTYSTFLKFCNTDFRVDPPLSDTTATVITTLQLSSFEACLDACSIATVWTDNLNWTTATGTCQSATWTSGGSNEGQCWLRNATARTDGSNGLYVPNDMNHQTGTLLGA